MALISDILNKLTGQSLILCQVMLNVLLKRSIFGVHFGGVTRYVGTIKLGELDAVWDELSRILLLVGSVGSRQVITNCVYKVRSRDWHLCCVQPQAQSVSLRRVIWYVRFTDELVLMDGTVYGYFLGAPTRSSKPCFGHTRRSSRSLLRPLSICRRQSRRKRLKRPIPRRASLRPSR